MSQQQSPTTMKAWLLKKTYQKSLDFAPDAFELSEKEPIPQIEEDDVLIEVKAVSLNPVDYKVSAFGMPVPFVPGLDVAGVVAKIGAKVNNTKVGDRVVVHGNLRGKHGGFAEYSVCKSIGIIPLPNEVSFNEAASLPTAGFTAYQALFDKLRVRKGETIFITGAAGGVGQFALQLCKLHGLVVFASCSAKNMEKVKKMGADHVFDYNSKEDLQKQIMQLTNGRGLDFWFDVVGAESANYGLTCLAFSGSIVVVQGNPTTAIGTLFSRQISIHDVFLGGAWQADNKAKERLVSTGKEMVALVAQKKLDCGISHVIKFEQIPEYLMMIKENKHSGGKIVADLGKK